MHAHASREWWQVLLGCVVEAFLLDFFRRRRGESRYTRWPH